MSREAHELLEYSDYFTPDESASDPEAWAEYAAWDFADPAPMGVKVRLSEAGREHLRQHPEDEPLLAYGLQKTNEDPRFGDSDYYAPDPYFRIVKEDLRQEFERGEQELAIETVHLFGLNDAHDVSDRARTQLFHVGVNLSEQEYDRIGDVAGRMSTGERKAFAEAFLATEFGDDFAGNVLTIAERTTPEQSRRVFEAVNRFRDFSEQFSGWFEAYDPQFAASAQEAINERLTDALTTLAEVAEQGSLTVDVSPNDARLSEVGDDRFVYELHSMDEAVETLELLDTATEQLGTVIGDKEAVVSRVTKPNENFSTFRINSREHGAAILYIRPEGAKGYDRQYEYGTRNGVEASISFIVNPGNPHSLRPDKDPEGVSIRFDREGRSPGEAPNSPDRDPTREDGLVSVDISSLMGEKTSSAARIGRFIAAGNRLRARAIGTEDSLHHNVLSDQRYGKATNFKRLAQYLEAGMDALAQANHPGLKGMAKTAVRSRVRRAA